MQFNHGNMVGPSLAAELASLAGRGWDHGSAAAVLRGHGVRRPDLSVEASRRLGEWAARLRAPFAAEDVKGRCEAINALLEAATQRMTLSTHDGHKPHLHFASDHDDVVARVTAITAGGLAIFTVESEGGRLGACARAGCPEVFVDTSRNGRRAYCSARCGNHDAVQRHRSAARRQAR
ncbi:CGNR zinc finger domain-containing protein [Dietzia aurantiaca]|uniref:CGNR zinc finger domain-containing protein n=1 Tax=Dietzia aurantiaca TaxID=983873 RepID=UPI001E378979|nr:CGNR zinc finger domain-containing protein [Dietzia aurantiaca]MCD2262632.1 CGNR zinc finger domain-containing protein [Dietzia aurantiaca]